MKLHLCSFEFKTNWRHTHYSNEVLLLINLKLVNNDEYTKEQILRSVCGSYLRRRRLVKLHLPQRASKSILFDF